MSLTVKQLTDDGSFLLTFAPIFAPPKCPKPFPGTFRILIDPWLHGESTILHSKFATTQHTVLPSISSLAAILHEIDLILITQEKADHLHRETLCTLPKDCKVGILAPPKAAKLILDWKHFNRPEIVQVLKPYNEKKPETVVKIPIDPYSSASAEGEVTIANVLQKKDIAGIHNALGITYRPPGTLLTAPDGKMVNLANMPMMSQFPPNPYVPKSLTSKTSAQRFDKGSLDEIEWAKHSGGFATDHDDYNATNPPQICSRADSPLQRPSTSHSRPPSVKSVSKRQHNSEKVLSVIYTPHGTDAGSLHDYAHNHLSLLENALPVTMLVHGLTFETNPWWMGGVVCAGAPGGVKIAHDLGVKYWLGAHDELKETEGLATKLIVCKRYDVQEVTNMLRETDGPGQGHGIGTEVVALRAGEKRRFVG